MFFPLKNNLIIKKSSIFVLYHFFVKINIQIAVLFTGDMDNNKLLKL